MNGIKYVRGIWKRMRQKPITSILPVSKPFLLPLNQKQEMFNQIAIERERDQGLRAYEYVVVSHDREGNEVDYIKFYVSDSGRIYSVSMPKPL
ncbi:hypothetical protein LCGC14_2099120 [marine sediment metagenome]|uniref:Uncharacterized protein n=1 Tax=marine sediment metagenome TaxID=412755 RepID=A0A0F9EAD4_9ZZZZ